MMVKYRSKLRFLAALLVGGALWAQQPIPDDTVAPITPAVIVPGTPVISPTDSNVVAPDLGDAIGALYNLIKEAEARGEDIRAQELQLEALIRQLDDGPTTSIDGRILESEAETVASCLNDLASESADVRLSAVTVLGKYSTKGAQAGIMRSLRDPSAAVRQSALVSLTEKRRPPADSEAIIELFADPNHHIRRIVTSSIRELLSRRSRIYVKGKLQKPDTKYSDRAVDIIIQAFADTDVIVRKNMITYYSVFRTLLRKKPEAVTTLLYDTDRDIRVLALKGCRDLVGRPKFVEFTGHMVDDQDRLIRLQLATILATGNYPEAEATLEKLALDEDFEVSTEAWYGLFRAVDQKRRITIYNEHLRPRLDEPTLHSHNALKIIRTLSLLKPAPRETAYRDLMQHSNAVYRLKAVTQYTRAFSKTLDLDLMFAMTTDTNRKIRAEASKQLRKKRFNPDPEQCSKLLSSPYSDVRRDAAQMLRHLDKKTAESPLMDLLLDDNNNVRRAAISEIFTRQIGDWLEIVEESLVDEDKKISNVAATLLMRSKTPEAKAVVQKIRASRDRSLINLLNRNRPSTKKNTLRSSKSRITRTPITNTKKNPKKKPNQPKLKLKPRPKQEPKQIPKAPATPQKKTEIPTVP